MDREAIILAGGFGTRLRDIINDIPKSMAPVHGKPFLEYILAYLSKSGFKKIILATGYKSEVISDYFGKTFSDIELKYSVEKEPLGTGGAIRLALPLLERKNFFIINGDTLFRIDMDEMERLFRHTGAILTIALKPMKNFERYGSVSLTGERIVSFNEKKFCAGGLINGGIYLVNKNWFERNIPGEIFSFEKDIMEKRAGLDPITGYISESYFIDIGIPEDYNRAISEFLP